MSDLQKALVEAATLDFPHDFDWAKWGAILIDLLPAHDSEIREQAKAELFNQLYAAAGTEAMDAYRATHPGPLTVLDAVKAIREQCERAEEESRSARELAQRLQWDLDTRTAEMLALSERVRELAAISYADLKEARDE